MFLVYYSMTGNVKNFVERVGLPSKEINPTNPCFEVNEDYIVVVPSYVGYVNEDVEDFIDYSNNKNHLVGFASSGNLNFGELFCINAKQLSKKYNKPLIFTFEYMGTDLDIEKFKKEVYKIEQNRS